MGYRGRTTVHEILIIGDDLRKAVNSGDIVAIRCAATRAGAQSLLLDGMAKAAEGITSVQEVLRVTAEP